MRDLAVDAFAPDGALSHALPGFSPRPQQREMAERVAHVLAEGGAFACEAGTGTGKTLAYLVPALDSQRRCLISTGTRHLQDQLFFKDLPIAIKALERGIDRALLKGRSNYLCRFRLRQSLETPDAVDRRVISDLVAIRQWSTRTTTGDAAELGEVSESSPAWRLATSTRDNCLGSACDDFDDCFLFKARRRAAQADLVVVNHHLLLAQFVLDEQGHGELLPEMDALIVDEAHQLPDLASEFFGTQFSSAQAVDLCRDVDMARRTEAQDMAELSQSAGELETAVRALRLAMGGGARRMAYEALIEDSQTQQGLSVLEAAVTTLTTLLEHASERGRALASCAQRASAIGQKLKVLGEAQPADQLSWMDVRMRGFTWRLSPLDVSEVLGPRLRAGYRSLVLTSATLAVAGRLDHFLDRSGLDDAEQAVLPSPFDYAQQSLLYVPADFVEPNAPTFTEMLHARIRDILSASGGRAFVLFTSHGALNRAKAELAPRLPFPVLVQGDRPRGELLERFRRLGDAVLLGSYSFWEGVDVRGEALSCVIIDKLPFASPGDPVLQARIDALRERGGNPFMDEQLPHAVITLKQGVGRLIRDVSDRGVLVICDPRLLSKRYGRVFLNSLPDMQRTRDFAVVDSFLGAEGADR